MSVLTVIILQAVHSGAIHFLYVFYSSVLKKILDQIIQSIDMQNMQNLPNMQKIQTQ